MRALVGCLPMEHKKCTKCGLEKPLNQFHRQLHGFVAACKECRNAYGRSHPSSREQRDRGNEKARNKYATDSKHRAKQIRKTRLWCSGHSKERIAAENRRRARKRGIALVASKIGPEFYVLKLAEYEHRCAYCRIDLRVLTTKIHWDHVVPLSRGGSHVETNLVPACALCNQSKNAKDLEAFLAEGYERFIRQKSI